MGPFLLIKDIQKLLIYKKVQIRRYTLFAKINTDKNLSFIANYQ